MINKNKLIQSIKRPVNDLLCHINQDRKIKFSLMAVLVFMSIYVISKSFESNQTVYKSSYSPQFKKGRILNNSKSSFLRDKEQLLGRVTKKLMSSQKKLVNRIDSLEKQLIESQKSVKVKGKNDEQAKVSDPIKYHPPDVPPMQQSVVKSNINMAVNSLAIASKMRKRNATRRLGPSVISFPVKQKRIEEGVVLPTGSYVKAKLMTGIDAPEGKNYPVLLALDYSYIGPNKHRVDLTGCFMIAKTSPSLATERINFQATKLSCVSKNGKFFEKKVNGFVADDGDNTFAVKAELHSKQGQVARMAFMKSIVDGIGEIITRKSKAIGGKNPDSANVMIQNGAQGAASKVSDWYLKQATSLLPTLSVGSGQDVWVIMQEKVVLPNDFFRKNERRNKDAKVYSYFSRAID